MFDREQQYIIPRYKLIVMYDIDPYNREQYYKFVMGEMVPALQDMGIYMTEAWHTAFGEYPLRMATFVAEDLATIENVMNSERWYELEGRFVDLVSNYSKIVVPYRRGFQFIR